MGHNPTSCFMDSLKKPWIWGSCSEVDEPRACNTERSKSEREKHMLYINTYIWTLGLEKEMTTHSSILAWRIPWIEESGGLQSIGSQRVGHNWVRIWNLEKWYWGTYLQGVNRDVDVGNELVDTAREGEGGTNWENSFETYITVCKIDG